MFRACGDQVNARGFNAAVPEDIGQLYNVPAGLVKRPRKQVPQIVREHLAGRNPRLCADRFHFRPNLCPGEPFPASGKKNLAGSGFLSPCVFQELGA